MLYLDKLFINKLYIFALSIISIFCLPTGALADHGFVKTLPDTHDHAIFNAGSMVSVYVDAKSFIDAGFPSSFTNRNALELIVNRTISNWREYGNVNLVITWGGFTDQFPNHGPFPALCEILITARNRYEKAETGDNNNPRAQTDWTTWGFGRTKITFYKQFVDPDNPFTFVSVTGPGGQPTFVKQYNYKDHTWQLYTLEPVNVAAFQDGAVIVPFDGVLMHEFGHALGLGHNDEARTNQRNPTVQRTVMNTALTAAATPPHTPRLLTPAQANGPFIEDQEDLLAIYGHAPAPAPGLEMRQKNVPFSINPFDWRLLTEDYAPGVDLSASPVTAILEKSYYDFFFRNSMGDPKFMYGSRSANVFTETVYLSMIASDKTLYAVAGDGGNDNKYLAAWVDSATHVIRVVKATDGGFNWTAVDSALGSPTTFAAPAICRLGPTTWMLCYSKTNLGSSADVPATSTDLDKVAYRITIDDGKTWGSEDILSSNGEFLRAIRSVTMAASSINNIMIGFTSPLGQIYTCYASYPGASNTRIKLLKSVPEPNSTSTEPSLAASIDHTYGAFVDGQDPSRTVPIWNDHNATDRTWKNQSVPDQRLFRSTDYPTRAALATDPSNSAEVYMFSYIKK